MGAVIYNRAIDRDNFSFYIRSIMKYEIIFEHISNQNISQPVYEETDSDQIQMFDHLLRFS